MSNRVEFVKNGAVVQVNEDDSTPSNNVPLLVKVANPIASSNVVEFVKNGVTVSVSEDGAFPSNNLPLPVKLTSVTGDVIVNAGDLNVDIKATGSNPSSVRVSDGTNELGITASKEAKTNDANVLAKLPSDPSLNGVPITGQSLESGGTNVLGWLSSIRTKIAALITALGNPFQAGGSIGNTAFGINNTDSNPIPTHLVPFSSFTTIPNITVPQTTASTVYASTACKKIIITANLANTDAVYIGGNGLVVDSGFTLFPSDYTGITLEIDNLNKIYMVSAVAGQKISINYKN